MGSDFVQSLQNLKAVHVRHVDVAQHKIGRRSHDAQDAFLTAKSDTDINTAIAQFFGDQACDLGIIFDT
jgi:hypothetical protein